MSTLERPLRAGRGAALGPDGDQLATDATEPVLLTDAGPTTRPTRATDHVDGLDGLRALAIAAVVVYHVDESWLPGGFLGVDVFFVVSGFLITSLLHREAVTSGRIALRRFWVRRARRLLPALAVCVVLSVVAARVAHHDLVVHIGRQVAGALTFSTNWVEIIAGSSYFDQTSPQLFMNFWSLAVEEQFYLGWPLVIGILVAAGLTRRTRLPVALGVAVAVALLSTLLMAVRFVPGQDATRVYYGTDTHVMGLMIGAGLAFVWASDARGRWSPAWLCVRKPAMAVALGTLGVLMWTLTEESTWTFRGGIALACLATAVLVAALLPVGTQVSRWSTLLSTEPLLWVGRRSYGIYLWHWPVIVIVGQDMRTAPGTFQHGVSATWCVLVTLALADLSYRFVEAPVRVWGFRACGRMALAAVRSGASGASGSSELSAARWLPRAATGATALLLVLMAAVVVTAPDRSDTQRTLEQNAAAPPASTGPAPAPSAAPTPSRLPTATATAAGPLAGSVPQDWSMPTGDQIDAFGDSMLVATQWAVDYYFPGVRQDGKSNRRWSDGLSVVTARATDIRRAVVLAYGTNAGVNEQQLTAVLDDLGPSRMVVLVNLYVRASWVEESNAMLARATAARPNVIVADWNAAIKAHLDLLQSDGVHPTITGAHLFAKTIRAAMAELSTRHTGKPVVLKELRAY